jgi:hypothetical protein
MGLLPKKLLDMLKPTKKEDLSKGYSGVHINVGEGHHPWGIFFSRICYDKDGIKNLLPHVDFTALPEFAKGGVFHELVTKKLVKVDSRVSYVLIDGSVFTFILRRKVDQSKKKTRKRKRSKKLIYGLEAAHCQAYKTHMHYDHHHTFFDIDDPNDPEVRAKIVATFVNYQ